jgi:hypothetical protein
MQKIILTRSKQDNSLTLNEYIAGDYENIDNVLIHLDNWNPNMELIYKNNIVEHYIEEDAVKNFNFDKNQLLKFWHAQNSYDLTMLELINDSINNGFISPANVGKRMILHE